MRFIVSLAVIVAFSSFNAFLPNADASVTNQLRLTIELRDGSRVVGRPEEKSLQIRSEILGEIKLPLDGISSIEWQAKTNLATIKTSAGDTLAAAMVTKTIRIATSFGDLNLATDTIRRVNVSRSGLSGETKAGLVSLWSGEGGGADSIGGHNARLIGGVSLAPGRRGQAFFLDGASYLKVSVTPELDIGKESGLTIACWVNPSTTATQMPLIEYEQTLGSRDGSDVGLLLYINLPPAGGSGQGCIAANLQDTTQTSHIIASPPHLLRAGVWQHVALTYDRASGDTVIYLNDSEVVGSQNLGSFKPETEMAYLLIGARTAFGSAARPSDAFVGGLDGMGFYNRALSASEIQAIYAAENGGAEAN